MNIPRPTRILLSALFVACSLIPRGSHADESVSVLQLVRESEGEAAEARFERAQSLARQATELDPAWGPAWRQYGLALLRGDRADEAIPAFRRAIDLAEDDATAWRGLAQALWRADRQPAAVNAQAAYLRIMPRDAVAWRDLATWSVRLGRTEQAIAALERVVELTPDAASAWRDLGVLHLRQRRVENAVPAFENVLRYQPDDAAVLRDLGWSLWALDRRDEALPRLAKAVELGVAERQRVVLQVVARLAEEGAIDSALTFYRHAHPDAPLTEVALDLARRGRLIASEPLLQEAWRTEGPSAQVGLQLAYVRAVNGRIGDVGRYLAPFLEQTIQAPDDQVDLALETLRLCSANPDVPELITRLEAVVGERTAFDAVITDLLEKSAEEQRVRHEHAQALSLYRRVLERDPNRTRWIWAYHLSTLLESATATAAWLAEIESRATAPAVLAGIAGIRADRAGTPDQAVLRLGESVSIEPYQPVLRQMLFRNYLKLGRIDDARAETLWFAQQVAEGESPLRSYLAELLTQLGEQEEALVHWQLLHLAYPESLTYGLEAAFALYQMGQAEAAFELLRDIASEQPDSRLYELMAEIATALDRKEDSFRESAQGLGVAPSPALFRLHAESAERLTNYPAALTSAQAYLRLDPGYTPMALLAGRSLQALERPDDARRHHENLLARNPFFLPSLLALRDAAIQEGRFTDAIAFARIQTRVQPDQPDAQRRYAHALAQAERFRPALQSLRRLARLHPGDAMPLLIYRLTTEHPYPGRNSVAQIERHIERLSEQGYRFVNAPSQRDPQANSRQVMIILLDPDASVVEALDPVLAAFDARVVYAANSAIPPRALPGIPVPDFLTPLIHSGRWHLASSGPVDRRRQSIDADGVPGNSLIQPVWSAAGEPETEADYVERLNRILEETARPLANESERLLVYPAGDFGQRSLDIRPARSASRQGAVAQVFDAYTPDPFERLKRFRKAVSRHFTHAVYFDDAGFWLPGLDPLRIPARVVPPNWDADALEHHLTQANPIVRARLELGRVLYWHGQHEEAMRAFARAAEAGADPREIAFHWGVTADRQGDIPVSLARLRQAQMLDPESKRIADAIERAESQRRPQLQAFLLGWEDNEDRSLDQAGVTGDLFLGERLRLGVTWDRNRWETAGMGKEHGYRAGLRGRMFLLPQTWLTAHLWHLDMDTLSDRWGGEASLRLSNPVLHGYFDVFGRRAEIDSLEALRSGIDARAFGLRTYTRLLDRFDLFADLSRNARSDDNTTDMLEGRLLYRLKEWPYAGLGWRFRFADSDRDPPEYWAPEALEQHQAHADLRGSWQRLRGSLSGDAGYAREQDTDWRFVWGARGEADLYLGKRVSLSGSLGWFEGPVYNRLSWRAGVTGRF